MATGNDWLWRPVLRGMCSAERLRDTVFNLFDFWEMNEAIDVDEANRRRIEKALMEKK